MMIDTIADITQKLWEPAKDLHQDGLSYHAYLTELTWLLFLKIAPALGEASHLPKDLSWQALIHKSGTEQYEYYQTVIKELGQISDPYIAGIYAHACTSFKQPEQLAQAITTLAAVDEVPIDDLGEVYETLLEECAYEDDNRLHIAPRSLVNLMVISTQPQTGELIQDPLAGTGSLVVAADQYIQVISDEYLLDLSTIKKDIHQQQNIIAIEPDLVRQRLALMNCLLHHIDHPQRMPVRWGDSLLSNLQLWPQADVILSILVFASEPTNELGKHDASLALLQHIYQTLKPGGRAAVVVPDKILKAAGPAQQVRSTLLDTCIVHTVLRLPDGIFYPHQLPAHLLFFRKGQTADEKTQTVWFYDSRTYFPAFGQYLHLTREHILPFETVYGDDPLGQAPRHEEGEDGRWRGVNRETLAKQDDRLDWCWLPHEKVTTEAVVMENEIATKDNKVATKDNIIPEEVWEILDKTVKELEALMEILRE